MKTETKTLAAALDVLAHQIQSDDGVANTAIAEAAERLRELDAENAKLRANEADLIRALAEQRVENAKLRGILFDGHRVYSHLTDDQKRCTSADNVADTLDAIVRALK